MQITHFYVSSAMFLYWLLSLSQITMLGRDGKLRTSSLTKAQKPLLLPALEDATGEHRSDLLNNFTVFPEPLADKGAPAPVAISTGDGCAEHSNCPFFIFREDGKKDKLILDSVAGDYDILTTRHHDNRDISLTNYQGVTSIISVWSYDGMKYRVRSCLRKTTDGKQAALPVEQCGS